MKEKDQKGRLEEHLWQLERGFIQGALRTYSGHTAETAQFLGIARRTLYEKLREHGLDEEAYALRSRAKIPGPRSRRL